MRMSSLAFADSMRRRHAAMHRIDQLAQFSAEHGAPALHREIPPKAADLQTGVAATEVLDVILAERLGVG